MAEQLECTRESMYSDLYGEIAAMEIGDCLQWTIPAYSSARNISAALSAFMKDRGSIMTVRVLFEGDRAFFVRVK